MCQLNDLSSDLLLSILSYIVVLPFEQSTQAKQSNLTNVFPLVSKRFYTLCTQEDYLWKVGVERLIRTEPNLWGRHLSKRLLQTIVGQEHVSCKIDDTKQLLRVPTTATTTKTVSKAQSHRQIFQETLRNDIITTLPFLYDFTDQSIPHDTTGIVIGEEFDVYVSQPPQQAFITTLMEQFATVNRSYRNGDEIVPEHDSDGVDVDANIDLLDSSNSSHMRSTRIFPACPTFVYLNEPLLVTGGQQEEQRLRGERLREKLESPLSKVGEFAPKVEVRECLIYPDNSAQVRLMPVSYVRIHSIHERPGTEESLIYDANVSHFGKVETNALVIQQRQNAELSLTKRGLEVLNRCMMKIASVFLAILGKIFEKFVVAVIRLERPSFDPQELYE